MSRLDEIKARLENLKPLSVLRIPSYANNCEYRQSARFYDNAPADIAYLLSEVERLREVLTEIVESVDDDKHPMNSYAAGYAGGLRENVERAQKALKGGE